LGEGTAAALPSRRPLTACPNCAGTSGGQRQKRPSSADKHTSCCPRAARSAAASRFCLAVRGAGCPRWLKCPCRRWRRGKRKRGGGGALAPLCGGGGGRSRPARGSHTFFLRGRSVPGAALAALESSRLWQLTE
ncbi:hypothetical protein Nmel_016200, partial [Mimus melanotis]